MKRVSFPISFVVLSFVASTAIAQQPILVFVGGANDGNSKIVKREYESVARDSEYNSAAIYYYSHSDRQSIRDRIKSHRDTNPNARVVLVGHSLGGASAMAVARYADYPIAMVVTCDPVHPTEDGPRSLPNHISQWINVFPRKSDGFRAVGSWRHETAATLNTEVDGRHTDFAVMWDRVRSRVKAGLSGRWAVSYGGTSKWTPIFQSDSVAAACRIGDFDGNGKADIFTTGGGEFNVIHDGQGRWNTLNRSNSNISAIRLGDFDGDGKTDVLTTGGGQINVSFGGTSQWKTTVETNTHVSSILIGDFDGDKKSDVFTTGGGQFNILRGATGSWNTINNASAHVSSLLAGDFNGDGKDDILQIHSSGQLNVSHGGSGQWQTLNNVRLDRNSIKLGDFDGDGKTDILQGHIATRQWNVLYGGTGQWKRLNNISTLVGAELLIGDINGDGKDDVITSYEN